MSWWEFRGFWGDFAKVSAYLRIARYGGMTSYAAALFGFGLNGGIIGSGNGYVERPSEKFSDGLYAQRPLIETDDVFDFAARRLRTDTDDGLDGPSQLVHQLHGLAGTGQTEFVAEIKLA